MSKNIVVFSDGTGQQGGVRPDQVLSNVYKLYRASRVSGDNSIDPAKQIVFYDPGLGTVSDTGLIRFSLLDKVKSICGQAFGVGITDNVIDCYEFILENYQPGDRIYLFGFSRGAYTVRSVAGVLRMCGVPTHDSDGSMLPTSGPKLRRIATHAVKDVYEFHLGKAEWSYEPERLAPAKKFREEYGSSAAQEDDSRHIYSNVAPYFIGVFDTVAALVLSGWKKVSLFFLTSLSSIICGGIVSVILFAYNLPFVRTWIIASLVIVGSLLFYLYRSRWKATSYDKSLDFRVTCARHAMAIDEWRSDFEKVGWGKSDDVRAHKEEEAAGGVEWLKQVWFAGDHSDIGGSYPETESRLSDVTLRWMIDEINSTEHPLEWNKNWLNVFPDPTGMQHDEIAAAQEKRLHVPWSMKLREVEDDAVLHESVLERFRCKSVKNFRVWGAYRPANLRNHVEVAKFYEPETSSLDGVVSPGEGVLESP